MKKREDSCVINAIESFVDGKNHHHVDGDVMIALRFHSVFGLSPNLLILAHRIIGSCAVCEAMVSTYYSRRRGE